jgi:hypothetical protein
MYRCRNCGNVEEFLEDYVHVLYRFNQRTGEGQWEDGILTQKVKVFCANCESEDIEETED